MLGIADSALRRRLRDYKRSLAQRVAFDADDLISTSRLSGN
jgi:hypothetical protein